MELRQYLLAEMDREVERSKKALEQVPEGKYDWKPHTRSMIFGYLVEMVATIPSWIAIQVTRPDLDIAPTDGSNFMARDALLTSAALLAALEHSAEEARTAFETATDEHLKTTWQLKARGQVVLEGPRLEVIQDTINHWVHHRGQMTVYLRMMGAKVPALYGPSADDHHFS